MKNYMNRTVSITITTFCILIFLNTCPKNVFSASTYEFQLTDSNDLPAAAFAQGDRINYKLTFNFDFPTIIISTVKIAYQGAPNDDLGIKITIFLPGISSEGLNGPFSNTRYWRSTVPKNAWDTSTVTLRMFTIPGILSVVKKSFTVQNHDPDDISDGNDSYICSACHQPLYEGWKTSKHYPSIRCVSCHGSGEDHISGPSPDNIMIPSSGICNVCHSRNNGTDVETENGFIKHMQQTNEISSTGHSRLNCLTCHNPHYGPSAGTNFGIKRSCSSCHTDQEVGLNMQGLDCINCHMPDAIENNTSTGTGNHKKGDVRTHIVRIKGTDSPEDMFNITRTKLALDETAKPFLTVNFACLTCHNGVDAVFQNYDAMQITHGLIH